MACGGCEKRRREAEARKRQQESAPKYQVTTPNGTRTVYPTELAAKAANARNGNRGTVKKL